MKRSLIAVCLLLLSPSRVIACYEDHNAGAGWFDQQTLRWSSNGSTAHTMQRNILMDVSFLAGVSGVVILLGVLVRAKIQAAGYTSVSPLQEEEQVPLVVPFDAPVCDPRCGASGLEFKADGWSTSEMWEMRAESATWAASAVDSFCCVN